MKSTFEQSPVYLQLQYEARVGLITPARRPSWRDDDDLQHVEDTRLCYVTRNGRILKVQWNNMSTEERREQRIADARSAEIALFDPCGLELY